MLAFFLRHWLNRKLSKKQAYVRHLASELEDITDDEYSGIGAQVAVDPDGSGPERMKNPGERITGFL